MIAPDLTVAINANIQQSVRRYDLDWIRIAAFGVLIFYHIGMFYVTWPYHVKSVHASAIIEPAMLVVNPWRLTLLFFISGVAMRFMADKMKATQFVKARSGRLLPPLLMGMLVIVPPQTYYEVVQAIETGRALPGVTTGNFYARYLTSSGHWCGTEACLVTPTWNHLWFVAYLLVYAGVLGLLASWLRRAEHRVLQMLRGWGLFLVPWVCLTFFRITLFPIFGETHAFVDDWYVHAVSLGAVLLGFFVARDETVFRQALRWRWGMLAIAVSAYAALAIFRTIYAETEPAEILVWLMRAVREAQAWAAILAVLGFFHRHLRHADGLLRQTLTHAVFPAYLIHQTIIVVAGYHFTSARLPAGIEALALIFATCLGCWIFYEFGRRIEPLRIWIGLPSTAHITRKATA